MNRVLAHLEPERAPLLEAWAAALPGCGAFYESLPEAQLHGEAEALWRWIAGDQPPPAAPPAALACALLRGGRLIRQRLEASGDRAIVEQAVGEHVTRLVLQPEPRERALAAQVEELRGFAHHVAHDLKAPLRTISGFTAILVEELQLGASAEELKDLAGRAQRAAERAAELIDGLLVLAKATRAAPEAPRPVSLSELLEAARERLAERLAERDARLEIVADEARIHGDPAALTVLLVELVRNAIDHTDGPSPRVELGLSPVEPGRVALRVRDFGRGIAASDQERLFRVFATGHTPPVGAPPGLGVGLTLVRRIALQHDGEVHVDSELGAGCTFTLHLPGTLHPSGQTP